MRYSTELKYRRYVEGYSFSSFVKRFGDKYCKILMDTATKTGIDAAKLLLKELFKIKSNRIFSGK